ncbi:MAG: hypothetical protein ACQXXL_03410 [Candidatus Methanosuratincola sp.]
MIEELGESGMKMLMMLNKGPAKLSDFKIELGMGSEAIYRCLVILLKHNIIKEEEDVKGNKRIFSLTEKGKKVAEYLKAAQDLLESP